MSLQAKCRMVFAHMQFNKYFLNIRMQKCSAEVQSMDPEAELPGYKSQGCHLLAEHPCSPLRMYSSKTKGQRGHFLSTCLCIYHTFIAFLNPPVVCQSSNWCPQTGHWGLLLHWDLLLFYWLALLNIMITFHFAFKRMWNSNSESVAQRKTAWIRVAGLNFHPTFMTIHVTLKCSCVSHLSVLVRPRGQS